MEPARGTRAGFSRSIDVNAPGSGEAGMTSDERCNLVLAFARTLFVNGQATDQTVAAAERLARAVGLRASVTARWGELMLRSDGKDAAVLSQVTAHPAGVDTDRRAPPTHAPSGGDSGRP